MFVLDGEIRNKEDYKKAFGAYKRFVAEIRNCYAKHHGNRENEEMKELERAFLNLKRKIVESDFYETKKFYITKVTFSNWTKYTDRIDFADKELSTKIEKIYYTI